MSNYKHGVIHSYRRQARFQIIFITIEPKVRMKGKDNRRKKYTKSNNSRIPVPTTKSQSGGILNSFNFLISRKYYQSRDEFQPENNKNLGRWKSLASLKHWHPELYKGSCYNITHIMCKYVNITFKLVCVRTVAQFLQTPEYNIHWLKVFQ